MIALMVVAIAVSAIAFIFCTTVGVKMVMDDCPGHLFNDMENPTKKVTEHE